MLKNLFRYNAFERSVLRNIREHGCHINYVGGDETNPSLAYSVGFVTSVSQPEIIILGMHFEEAHYTINRVYEQCRDGLKLGDGVEVDGVFEGAVLISRQVEAKHINIDNFNSAMWYSREVVGIEMNQAFQLLWPSAKDSRYPWDPQAEPDFASLQPPLYQGRAH